MTTFGYYPAAEVPPTSGTEYRSPYYADAAGIPIGNIRHWRGTEERIHWYGPPNLTLCRLCAVEDEYGMHGPEWDAAMREFWDG